MATIFGTNGNNTLIVEADDLRGLAGNDTYVVANNLANDPANANRTIVINDTEGSNRLQLADGLQISRVDFLGGNAVQITLSNNARIQVVGADRFTFDIGGNAGANDTQGLIGRTFSQFAADLGVVLNNGSGSTAVPMTVQPGPNPVPPQGGGGGGGAPVVSIAATNTPAAEGNSGATPYTFTVTRTGDTATAVSANYAVLGSGATTANAADFAGGVLPTGTLNFAAGQTTQSITVNVAGDTVVESDEGFAVVLTSATGASIGTGSVARTIVNDDVGGADDFAGNSQTTGRVVVGGSATGNIEAPNDRDWFRVDLVQGTTYSVTLNGGTGTGGLADPFLTVFAPNGATTVGSDDDAGPGQNALLTFTAASTGAFFLEARSFGQAAGDVGTYTVAVAAVSAPPTASGFQIESHYTGPARFQALIDAAIARWEQIITGDLPDVQTANGVVDDLRIDLSIVAIDGAGGVLAQAGPEDRRSGANGLPYSGTAEFDVADADQQVANGTFDDVVLHEIGHILGIGTLWQSFGYNTILGRYTGVNGVAEYRTLSGNPNASFVPLELTGGLGTANVHWSESVFNTELLTGFIDNGQNPLSRLTIAALQDLGYVVNYAQAEAYALPTAAQASADEPSFLLPFETNLLGVTRALDAFA